MKKSLKFLGHIISPSGVKTDPEKIETVLNWSFPRTIDEMRSFLGFTNYYRRFIEKYAELVCPLEKVMKDSANGNINTNTRFDLS